VLDLPQIYSKPSGTDLLRALDLLAVKPRSFSTSAGHEAVKSRTVEPTGVTRYLTSIISSPLSWLDTDELREAIWDTAAARLSERAGRTGKTIIVVIFEDSNAGSSERSHASHVPSLHNPYLIRRGAHTDAARALIDR
jgi:hypothetical protein